MKMAWLFGTPGLGTLGCASNAHWATHGHEAFCRTMLSGTKGPPDACHADLLGMSNLKKDLAED